MNRIRIAALILIALAALGAVAWWASRDHDHRWVQETSPEGETYWTCAMHPQVRQDRPGNCPICGMRLIERRADAAPAAPHAREDARRVLYWYDPMKPEVHFDAPGKSPFMDMDLVPRYAEADGGARIALPSAMVQTLGIRTAPVERGTFWQRVDTVGTVQVDAHRIRTVESRAAGWIEDQRVHAVGERVRAGERMAAVYAPELYAAQEELLLAARSGDTALLAAARERLLLLGATRAQVDAVLRTGRAERALPLLAPSDGVVLDIEAHEGRQIAPGMPLARIADLSRIWVIAEVPEAQVDWIGAGRAAEARLPALPGQVFEGTVDYVFPTVETATRTVRVRLVFDNPDWRLKPGMYADVVLFGGARRDVLTVPSEALIRTGTRVVVIVADEESCVVSEARDDSERPAKDDRAGRADGNRSRSMDGRCEPSFRPVAVEAGPERNDRTVILSGLDEGQRVVVSGQFLIDSEASLRGTFNRMSSGGTAP